MEFDNIETVKRAVEIEAGISLVPQGDTSRRKLAKQTLAEVKIEGVELVRPLAGDLQEEQSPFPRHEAISWPF